MKKLSNTKAELKKVFLIKKCVNDLKSLMGDINLDCLAIREINLMKVFLIHNSIGRSSK